MFHLSEDMADLGVKTANAKNKRSFKLSSLSEKIARTVLYYNDLQTIELFSCYAGVKQKNVIKIQKMT